MGGFLLASLVLLFVGAKLAKPTLFITGFTSFTMASFAMMNAIVGDAAGVSPTASCVLVSAVPLVAGLLGGILSVVLMNVAFAMLGLLAGAGVGYMAYVTAIHNWGWLEDQGEPVYWTSLGVFALIGMVVMLKYKNGLLALFTSFAGAAGVTLSMATLLGNADRDFLWLLNLETARKHIGDPHVYGQLLGFLGWFVLGLCVQLRAKRKEDEKKKKEWYAPNQGIGIAQPNTHQQPLMQYVAP
jgi:hypothetical protein